MSNRKCPVDCPCNQKNLKLRDIVLENCKFEKPSAMPENQAGLNIVQQDMRGGEFLVGEAYDEKGSPKTLRVKVTLGVRVATEEENPKVFVVIEASYVVVYDITGDLDSEHLKLLRNTMYSIMSSHSGVSMCLMLLSVASCHPSRFRYLPEFRCELTPIPHH